MEVPKNIVSFLEIATVSDSELKFFLQYQMKKDAQPRALLHQNQIINFYVEPNGVSAKKNKPWAETKIQRSL